MRNVASAVGLLEGSTRVFFILVPTICEYDVPGSRYLYSTWYVRTADSSSKHVPGCLQQFNTRQYSIKRDLAHTQFATLAVDASLPEPRHKMAQPSSFYPLLPAPLICS